MSYSVPQTSEVKEQWVSAVLHDTVIPRLEVGVETVSAEAFIPVQHCYAGTAGV